MAKYFAEYVESGTNYRLQTDKYDTIEEAVKATRRGMYASMSTTTPTKTTLTTLTT